MIDVFSSAFSRLRKHITVPNLFRYVFQFFKLLLCYNHTCALQNIYFGSFFFSHRTEIFRIKELAWVCISFFLPFYIWHSLYYNVYLLLQHCNLVQTYTKFLTVLNYKFFLCFINCGNIVQGFGCIFWLYSQ